MVTLIVSHVYKKAHELPYTSQDLTVSSRLSSVPLHYALCNDLAFFLCLPV